MDSKNTEDIAKEIIKPNLDLSVDYAEMALDEFIGDGLLREIPVVRTLVGIVKTGITIKERFFVKKFLIFLQTLHSNRIEKDELDKLTKKFESDKKYRDKTTEQISILIEKLDSINKTKVFAYLFRAHIKGVYDWNRFVALSKCLDKIQEISYPFLDALSKNKFTMSGGTGYKGIKELLESKGRTFDHTEEKGLLIATGIVYESGTFFGISKLGQDLFNYGISKILEK